jgi:hypothetical protein
MTADRVAIIIVGVVIAVRFLLYARFRKVSSGRRMGVGTLQLLVVVAVVALCDHFGANYGAVLAVVGVLAIICLSFLPVKAGQQIGSNPPQL